MREVCNQQEFVVRLRYQKLNLRIYSMFLNIRRKVKINFCLLSDFQERSSALFMIYFSENSTPVITQGRNYRYGNEKNILIGNLTQELTNIINNKHQINKVLTHTK